ncbi:MAG TPA: hypothetical protein DEB74_11745 [Lachnospiraceae bacterium]|nr:hypothetical protein [Lachnospiraceae bacterium]
MKIAILSDAHGNLIYFQKCMKKMQEYSPEKIVFLGDCFGYMCEGNIILDILRKLDSHVLLGNHEAMLLGEIPYNADKEEIYRLKIDEQNVSNSNFMYLKSLRPSYYEEMDGKKILYVHGRPDNPLNGYLYADDQSFNWTECQYDYIFMGHTHYPYIKKAGTTTYVNVGASGLPRDVGNAPSFVIFDTQTDKVVVHRVLVNEKELEMVMRKDAHPAVYKCLMRKGKQICPELM